MPTKDELLARFAELDTQGAQVPRRGSDGYGVTYADEGRFYEWGTSAIHLVELTFGKDGAHAEALRIVVDHHAGNVLTERLDRSLGVFRAAKRDFELGLVESLERTISGEVFGDFVGLAKAALDEGFKDVAAVLASAALEDCLKRYAIRAGLDVDGKSMQDIVNALKSKGLVAGAQKTLLDNMPKLRDYAMHASWDKLTPESVGGVIGFVEQFLLQHF